MQQDPERYFDLFIKQPLVMAVTAGPTIVACLVIGNIAGLSFTVTMIVSLAVGIVPAVLVYRHFHRAPEIQTWGPTSSNRHGRSD